jgi:serine phosphatase RsbU (regulator of sigma subunit)
MPPARRESDLPVAVGTTTDNESSRGSPPASPVPAAGSAAATTAQPVAPGTVYLVPIAGPTAAPIALIPPKQVGAGLTLGRANTCDICLPNSSEIEKVSRQHAQFFFDPAARQWRVSDLGSRWGTFLNGVKIKSAAQVPIREGDLLRITPWTFSLSGSSRHRRGLHTHDDVGQTIVRLANEAPEAAAKPLKDEMLGLLLESAAAIHGAQTERQLADVVMNAAVRGTGLPNAVMLRPLDASGRVEVIASRLHHPKPADSSGSGPEAPVTFSRSLINAASGGQVAELGGLATAEMGQSIVQMNISAALCVPLMLGTTPAAFLYLDSRGGALAQGLRPGASAFCVGLGRMASLALANLKRLDIERRQAAMEAELSAAALAQKWILPKRAATIGPFQYIGESRPGQYVGGDFFDVIDLASGRIAVAVGDVTGKGVAASVLMTATQGYLHAALLRDPDPGHAVTAVNRFVYPRRPINKFITMWVGIFDANTGTLSYVDAGHSYAMMLHGDGATFTALDEGDGLPIGINEDAEYRTATVPLAPGGCAMIVSDGIIEQFGTLPGEDGALTRAHFEIKGVRTSLQSSASAPDAVADLFNAVVKHAETEKLSDDATAVLVKW